MPAFLTILALFSTLALGGLFDGAAHAQTSEKVEIAGRCNYSDRLAPLRDQAHVFVECDRLEMLRSEGEVELTFSFPARLREIKLRGTFGETGKFAVSAIRLRSQRDWDEAEGECEFDPLGGNNPAVVCVVKSGPRFFVVNFASEA